MEDNNSIPSVDLNDFLSDDPIKKAAFVEKLGKAYEEIGFVAVTNHGINNELIDDLYSQIKLFFDLPDDVKSRYESANSGQRGFTSFGKEHAKDSTKGDLKEFWHFGQNLEKDDPLNEEYPENIFCEELPEFNKTGIEAYRTFEQTGKIILSALALYLNIDEHYFDQWVDRGNSILRPIYYPPLKGEPKGAVRAGAHEDINLITLLVGASAEGLEVLNRDGEWLKAKPSSDQIVVNVGDMLQRLTNNKLRSTTHRVVNPPKELWGAPRFSVPFFLHPQSAMQLNCLESCIDKDHPKQYDDILAGQYLIERLEEIGLKN
jgi:isopenicillin N synthase-like dioxygenase